VGCSDITPFLVNVRNSQDGVRLIFAFALLMFHGPTIRCAFVVFCKKSRQNIPEPVETMPSSWIATLCGESRWSHLAQSQHGVVTESVGALRVSKLNSRHNSFP